MCGRYQNRAEKQRIAEAFRVRIPPTFEIIPSYNIAPQTSQPIVRLNRDSAERELALLRWGLVPFFAKDSKIGYSTVNARAETVTTSPVFREAMKRRRCLVPATGFYEWKKLDKKAKQPWTIELADGDVFAFAGLWDRWKDRATGSVLETYTIITTDPNNLVQPLHDRMPVILSPSAYDRWLDPGDPERPPIDLLRPFPAEQMEAWRVSTAVGNVKNDSPNLRLPLSEEPRDLFSGLNADSSTIS
jgi:putative SOS response-associated peptidase YedK